MALITEIAPEIFRITLYVPEIDLQFSHFLVRDEQPLLFHAGYKLKPAIVTRATNAYLRELLS